MRFVSYKFVHCDGYLDTSEEAVVDGTASCPYCEEEEECDFVEINLDLGPSDSIEGVTDK